MSFLKKSLATILVSVSLPLFIFAHGQGDVEEIQVSNFNSWQEEFDLESRKPGKYNIMITATDLGGNQMIEGPYNLYVDPESDLPIAGITNPFPNMRVVGNLNIVGTCVDDDSVKYVELVFDGDVEHPIRAEGAEFWSYYLDTLRLKEGFHTIQVTGYDVNGLAGHSTSVTWQLDRTLPVTEVQDRTMGMLVHGNVNFKGTVSDGNGIKDLYYSVDNGRSFQLTRISKTKDKNVCNFNFSIDTRKFEDGPAVVWFRAHDKAGSIGYYSFLYFIDNTKPEVKIVSPGDEDVMNGKFSVAGFAKDTIGIEKLSWKFGDLTGDFELVPGNPYWCLNLDTTGGKEKSKKFTVHAIDKAGNNVEVSKTISLNQENDKPITTISEPEDGFTYNGDETVYVRGIVTDDDAVQSVKVQLDGGEAIVCATKGPFYVPVCNASELSAGSHKIIVTGIDINGIEGNPVTKVVNSKGIAPVYTDARIVKGKDYSDFKNGMEIHPESDSSFALTITSSVGIKQIHSEVSWGSGSPISSDIPLKNPGSYTYTLPITSDFPKGLVTLTLKATDSIDRESEYQAYIYVTNTSIVKNEEPIIVFSDSTVAEDGSIISDPSFPVSGYLIGGNAVSAELIPETPFATVSLKGNQIILTPQSDAIGSSEPVIVRVVTDKEMTIDSRELVFKSDTAVPTIVLNGYSNSKAADGHEGVLSFDGSVSCLTGIGSVKYRILGAKTELKNGALASAISDPIPDLSRTVELDEEGNFAFTVSTQPLDPGMYVVEIVAESAGGNKSAKAAAFNKVPPLEEVDGKMPALKAPIISWLDGFDVYAVATYQGEIDTNFIVFPRSSMSEGENPLTWTVTPAETAKPVSGKYTANKDPTLAANFVFVNGETYYSGKPVFVPYASKEAGKLTLYIDTGAVVSSVAYEITGAEVPGGDVTQSGTIKLTKPAPGETRWVVDVPLVNLPSRMTNIKVTIKAGSLEKVISGSIMVIRENSNINDEEKLYGFAGLGTSFDEENGLWILQDGSKYYFYANYNEPIEVYLEPPLDGLEVTNTGKFITLNAVTDGYYDNIVVNVKDRFGEIHSSDMMSFLSDSKGPEINLLTPSQFDWVNDYITLSGTVVDELGVRSVEYSFDNGENWELFDLNSNENATGVTFSSDIDISKYEDGLFRVDIRAIDNGGHIEQVRTAFFKDVTAPEVSVVVPLPEDVVNGQNLIVFNVKDNGLFAKSEYVAPLAEDAVAGTEGERIEFEKNPLTSTFVGTLEKPIDAGMSFIFTDDAGNSSYVNSWNFSIDNELDLPRAEIHVPSEQEVITRDFTISGVVYDDDGDADIFYKIDDAPYTQLERGTSFEIKVPLASMTDNEHSVTVYAVDVNGVKGEEVTRIFRISLEEPKGEIVKPTIDTSVRGLVDIYGVASDKNGIARVEVSLDNGNSYNETEGKEEWKYTVDTRVIPGGTQVVFLRITDNYGITGLYSSLVNIDNEAPDISIDLPLDDSSTDGKLVFSGYAFDNVDVKRLYATIRNMENTSTAIVRDLKVDRVISEIVDLRDLPDGLYNVEITGEDNAGNKTNVSRNIHLEKERPVATVDILYPLNGEHKNGAFNIYGQADSDSTVTINSLKLYIDDKYIKEEKLSASGFFKFEMLPPEIVNTGTLDEEGNPVYKSEGEILDGVHTYRVDAVLNDGRQVSSNTQAITYKACGPWITMDNFVYGDFAVKRPWMKGRAGYTLDPVEVEFCKTKEATKDDKEKLKAKEIAKIDVSFDNGKTFTTINEGKEIWKYRIENEDLPEGYQFMLLRATMKNGEVAIERTVVQIDNSRPTIKLIAPANGGHYNQKLEASGLTKDDVGIEDVRIALRKGDKAAYEIPSFIQGLYVDFQFWGETLWEFGAGITFFDDNVKLQAQIGTYTENQYNNMNAKFNKGSDSSGMRFGGFVAGGKLIANITSIPFSYFLGRDWDWLYGNVGIGAQFSLFSNKGQVLPALLLQLEFPRVVRHDANFFSAFSFYVEGALWFISSDVELTLNEMFVPQIGFGLRANIF
ncbi:MAG: hypothetical protein K5829_00740 [Treponema sp.]|nr:hypothetical protein [Treponema sp.]